MTPNSTYLLLVVKVTIICLFVLNLNGQAPGYYFHKLTTADGLSQASNAYILRDSRGFVWLSSIDGLNRFDGLNIKIYRENKKDSNSLEGQNVTSPILETKEGNLWLTTSACINRYNRKTDDFDRFYIQDATTKDTLTKGYLSFHLDNKEQLWLKAADEEGSHLYFFNTKTKTAKRISSIKGNRFLVVPNRDTTYIYSFSYSRKGFYRIKLLPDARIMNETLINPISSDFRFYDIATKGDTLYLASSDGLKIFLPKSNQWKDSSIHKDQTVFSVQIAKDSLLLTSVKGEGLNFFNTKAGYRSNIKIPYRENFLGSISSTQLRDIYLDEAQTLWLSDWEAGPNFIHLNKPKVQNIVLGELDGAATVSSIIRGFAEDDKGNVWCITSGRGILLFQKDGTIRQYNGNNGYPQTYGRSITCTSDGTVWVITDDGIYWYNELADAFELVNKSDTIGIDEAAVLRLTHDGKLLFHIYHWYEIVGKQTEGYSILKSNDVAYGNGKFVPNWYQDKDSIIYCNIDDRAVVMMTPNGQTKTLKDIVHFKACWESLEHQTIWFATTAGLKKYDKKTSLITSFDESNYLPNQYLYSVVPDESGHLWLSSNKGIIRFDTTDFTTQHFQMADGVWESEFYSNAWLRTSSGDIWLGNKDVINIVCPKDIELVATAPQIQITEALVNDNKRKLFYDEVQKDSLYIGECNELIFPYDENTLSFSFVALEYSEPQANQLWYQLIEKASTRPQKWLPITKGNTGFARYSNLSSGAYVFKIKAANADGVENTVPRELHITILKPFYLQTWFVLFMGLWLIGLIFWVYKHQVNKLNKAFEQKQRETELKQQAAENELKALRNQLQPHFFFNNLNNLYSLALQQSEKTPTAIFQLSQLMRYLLDNSKVDDYQEVLLRKEIKFTQSYLDLEKLRLGEHCAIHFEIKGKIFNQQIIPMLFINFIENSIKHGKNAMKKKGYIKILLEVKDKHVLFKIENNYAPNMPSLASTGIGLKNIKKQLALKYPNRHDLKIIQQENIFIVTLNLELNDY